MCSSVQFWGAVLMQPSAIKHHQMLHSHAPPLYASYQSHTSIPMKASTVVKLLLVAYIPLSAYYSATNVFEETTMDLDVSHSFFIKCILDSSRIEQDYLHQQQFGVHRYVE